MELASGGDAHDDWRKGQIGFRTDWDVGDDAWTVQGDAYHARESQLTQPDLEVEGANLLGRFRRDGALGALQVQTYFDYTHREQPADGVAFALRTYDLELQHVIARETHQLIWGAGVRRHDYDLTSSSSLLFAPESRDLTLANVFVQGVAALTQSLSLTLGLKYERDSYSGWNPLPDVRLAWKLSDAGMIWASASRAIRSPTPFDRDVIEKIGPTVFLTGDPSFDPESVDAFELGYRAQPYSGLSFSMSAFYNVYDRLRTIEPASATVFLPLRWGNLMEGETYGFEAWAKWQVAHWWRLSPGVRLLRKRLAFAAGASELLGLAQSGNDPRSQALVTSSMDIGPKLLLDATLRYVDSLPRPQLDSYYDLNAALTWRASPQLDLVVSGLNLLAPSHLEYPPPGGVRIRRSVLVEARWRF
jgi:iron complex outermembrane receptor protein